MCELASPCYQRNAITKQMAVSALDKQYVIKVYSLCYKAVHSSLLHTHTSTKLEIYGEYTVA
jgi:hypothetical protein